MAMTPTWIKLLKDVIAQVESGYYAETLEYFCPRSSEQSRIIAVDAAIASIFKRDDKPSDWCYGLNDDYILRKAAALLYWEEANDIEWHNRLNGEE
jgi:hypothetical protein